MIPISLRIIREQNRIYTLLLRMLSCFQPTDSRVYIFHDILDDESMVQSPFAISNDSFKSFLSDQLARGKHANTFEELSLIVLTRETGTNSFIITFDDAYESVYTKAYPFLKAHNIPFIVFITKELIGKKNYLNEDQIKALANDSLCTVGSHGLHHVMFRYLTVSEVENELIESKLFLEKLLNKSVECFAFPYGRLVECSFSNIEQLNRSNFLFSFSAIPGTLNQSWLSSNYFLPRINVDESLVLKILLK